jgi:hypothetical protein
MENNQGRYITATNSQLGTHNVNEREWSRLYSDINNASMHAAQSQAYQSTKYTQEKKTSLFFSPPRSQNQVLQTFGASNPPSPLALIGA